MDLSKHHLFWIIIHHDGSSSSCLSERTADEEEELGQQATEGTPFVAAQATSTMFHSFAFLLGCYQVAIDGKRVYHAAQR